MDKGKATVKTDPDAKQQGELDMEDLERVSGGGGSMSASIVSAVSTFMKNFEKASAEIIRANVDSEGARKQTK